MLIFSQTTIPLNVLNRLIFPIISILENQIFVFPVRLYQSFVACLFPPLQTLRHCSICSSLDTAVDPSSSASSRNQPEVPSVVQNDTTANMPHSWRVKGVQKLTYHHPTCEGAVCSIACVPVGKLMSVHGKRLRK